MSINQIKDFRQKVLAIKEKISEKEFFISKASHQYLQSLIEAVCKKYNNQIELHLHWDNSPFVAYATNRNEIRVNINNEFFHKGNNRIEKLVILKGILLHECGHLLFSDFHIMESSKKVFLTNRKLFPEPKCPEYTDILTDFVLMAPEEMNEWYEIYKHLDNALEDGFVENMILSILPGEGRCLESLRNIFYTSLDSIKVQKSKGNTSSDILFNSILSLAKYNTVKMDADDTDEESIKELLNQYNLIQTTVHTQKSYERKKLTNEIFCKFYHFLKEENKKEEKKEQEEQNQEPSKNQDKKKEQEAKKENSSEKKEEKNNQNTHEQNPQDSSSTENENRQNSSMQNKEYDNTKENQSSNSAKSILEKMQNSCLPDNINTGSGSVLNDNNIKQNNISLSKNNAEKISAMQNNIPTQVTPSANDLHQESNIAEDIASDKVAQEAEKELASQLKSDCQNMDYSPINKKIKIELIRENPSRQSIATYDKEMQDLRFLIKKTVDEFKRKLKNRQEGGKLNGMYMGRYLDQHSISRFDLRMLCKNVLPEDIPNMAFCIYLDVSGSMNSNQKIQNARRTCLLLYHIGLALNIPVMVYSHHATSGKVLLHSLADFGSVDGNDKYRICDMQAMGCNRDGMGLRFCSERLSKRKEEVKLMYVISDGLPSFYNSSAEAEQDIRNVLLDYSKKNVKYITVGLGEDQQRIEHLYTQDLSPTVAARFLSTQNAEELPVTIVETIRKMIEK